MSRLLFWIALPTLLGSLILLQHSVLEETPEKKEENVFTNVGDLPAKDMIPSYIGTLFLGSFRAVAVDALWIQLKEAQDTRRWYLAREIMEMISALQPHNQEVWSMLAWESAYNVANGEAQISEERAWGWIRYGILKLREGIRRNPRSPYLRYELARMLLHKPTWRDGYLNMGLLARVEADDEIQKQLQDPERDLTVIRERKSAFELSIVWFRDVLKQLAGFRERGGVSFRTQMGLLVPPDTMANYIRDDMFFQGIYEWKRTAGDPNSPHWALAVKWFRRAQEQCRHLLRTYRVSLIQEDFIELYHHMEEVLDASREVARVQNSSDVDVQRRALEEFVAVLESILEGLGRVGNGHLSGPLSEAKQVLSKESYGPGAGKFTDLREFNDTGPFASPVEEDQPLYGNLRPRGDADCFSILLKRPRPDRRTGKATEFHARTISVQITKIGQAPLSVRIFYSNRDLLATAELREAPDRRITFTASKPGVYTIDVRPADPYAPLPRDTRYRIIVSGMTDRHE